jgi:CheY-like chemotaxis protein
MMHMREIPPIPIVGLTAFTSLQDKQRCYEAGMYEVLAKPLQVSQFKKLISMLQ